MEVNNNALINIQKPKELSKKQLLFLYFILFSFIGWAFETLYSFFALGHFTKRRIFIWTSLSDIWMGCINFNFVFY